MENTQEAGACWRIKLTRTLWYNIYRATVTDADGEFVATMRLIPAIPLDREEVPAEAPEVEPYILAIVEDAAFGEDQLVEFETSLAEQLMAEMAQLDFAPAFCQFSYPSPPRGPLIAEFGG